MTKESNRIINSNGCAIQAIISQLKRLKSFPQLPLRKQQYRSTLERMCIGGLQGSVYRSRQAYTSAGVNTHLP